MTVFSDCNLIVNLWKIIYIKFSWSNRLFWNASACITQRLKGDENFSLMIFLEREGSGPQPCLRAAQVNDTLTQSEHMMSFSDTAIKRRPSAVSQFRASSFKVHILWLIDGNTSLSVFLFFFFKCSPGLSARLSRQTRAQRYSELQSMKYACILWFYRLIIKCKAILLCLVFNMCVAKGSP